MAWAHMKYTSVGVVEVDPGLNEPAIELPDLLQTSAPNAGKAPAPTLSKASAVSKASAPNGAASAPNGAASAVEGASAKAPPRGSGQGAGVYRHPAAKEAQP